VDGFPPDPAGGNYSAPSDPIAVLEGGEEKGKGREEKGKGGEGRREWERGGEGAGKGKGGERRGNEEGNEWAPTCLVKFTPVLLLQQHRTLTPSDAAVIDRFALTSARRHNFLL